MNALVLATLLIATDPHVLAPSLHDNGTAYLKYAQTASGRDLLNSVELWNAFLETAQREKPSAVIVTGDLTNHGERASHLLVAQGLERLRKAGVRAFVIPGNHDINNPWARAFVGTKQVITDSVTPDEFAQIYDRFGYGDALERDTDSLSYLAAVTPSQWILMLDSAVYDTNDLLGAPEVRGGFTDKSLEWMAACGRKAKAAGVQLLAAEHHSVADHSAVITDGYTVERAEVVAATLRAAGVRVVLTGHIHIQDISSRTTPQGPLYDVATNALSVFPNHVGRLRWSPAGDLHYRADAVTVPGSPLQTHAQQAFRSGANRLFADNGRELMSTLNENYFAGREDLNRALADTEAYRTLLTTEGFLGRYVRTMASDFDSLPDNQLDLP